MATKFLPVCEELFFFVTGNQKLDVLTISCGLNWAAGWLNYFVKINHKWAKIDHWLSNIKTKNLSQLSKTKHIFRLFFVIIIKW